MSVKQSWSPRRRYRTVRKLFFFVSYFRSIISTVLDEVPCRCGDPDVYCERTKRRRSFGQRRSVARFCLSRFIRARRVRRARATQIYGDLRPPHQQSTYQGSSLGITHAPCRRAGAAKRTNSDERAEAHTTTTR